MERFLRYVLSALQEEQEGFTMLRFTCQRVCADLRPFSRVIPLIAQAQSRVTFRVHMLNVARIKVHRATAIDPARHLATIFVNTGRHCLVVVQRPRDSTAAKLVAQTARGECFEQ